MPSCCATAEETKRQRRQYLAPVAKRFSAAVEQRDSAACGGNYRGTSAVVRQFLMYPTPPHVHTKTVASPSHGCPLPAVPADAAQYRPSPAESAFSPPEFATPSSFGGSVLRVGAAESQQPIRSGDVTASVGRHKLGLGAQCARCMRSLFCVTHLAPGMLRAPAAARGQSAIYASASEGTGSLRGPLRGRAQAARCGAGNARVHVHVGPADPARNPGVAFFQRERERDGAGGRVASSVTFAGPRATAASAARAARSRRHRPSQARRQPRARDCPETLCETREKNEAPFPPAGTGPTDKSAGNQGRVFVPGVLEFSTPGRVSPNVSAKSPGSALEYICGSYNVARKPPSRGAIARNALRVYNREVLESWNKRQGRETGTTPSVYKAFYACNGPVDAEKNQVSLIGTIGTYLGQKTAGDWATRSRASRVHATQTTRRLRSPSPSVASCAAASVPTTPVRARLRCTVTRGRVRARARTAAGTCTREGCWYPTPAPAPGAVEGDTTNCRCANGDAGAGGAYGEREGDVNGLSEAGGSCPPGETGLKGATWACMNGDASASGGMPALSGRCSGPGRAARCGRARRAADDSAGRGAAAVQQGRITVPPAVILAANGFYAAAATAAAVAPVNHETRGARSPRCPPHPCACPRSRAVPPGARWWPASAVHVLCCRGGWQLQTRHAGWHSTFGAMARSVRPGCLAQSDGRFDVNAVRSLAAATALSQLADVPRVPSMQGRHCGIRQQYASPQHSVYCSVPLRVQSASRRSPPMLHESVAHKALVWYCDHLRRGASCHTNEPGRMHDVVGFARSTLQVHKLGCATPDILA
ncbi:hypothetical protein GGX14DRAFT_645615 [Mycena pura]|uniref:Uncharacterized protein n=1 Tax=Mycena pura TaxID=153505 RepID=A0AAD6Y8B3_9AGAR|nr:hypothetical protein GGX14DRAFT_645615 [Mycena pura]